MRRLNSARKATRRRRRRREHVMMMMVPLLSLSPDSDNTQLEFSRFFFFIIIIAFAPFNFRIHFTVVFSTVWPPQGACKVGKGGERVSNFLLMFELRKKLNKKFTIFIFICVFIMKIEQS